jgi:BirA family transcriptional regulator, biotin operon repressor / biotin---[acetyl-CoA-carboxylase] ligase
MIDVVRILRETFVFRAEHHPTIGSTNDRAIQCAASGATDLPLLVVADQQTAGRGRDGHRWWTGPGALAFSLLVDPQMVAASHSRSPLVALAAAVAVVRTIAPLLPQHQVGIHWPNDVLAAGRKVAGILVEVLPDRRHVIGIGLNTNNTLADAPTELRTTASTLHDLSGKRQDQTDVLAALLSNLHHAFSQLRTDPQTIAASANDLCLQHGKRLTIQQGDRTTTGCFRGIAADGSILLETSAGTRAFCCGTVVG